MELLIKIRVIRIVKHQRHFIRIVQFVSLSTAIYILIKQRPGKG